MQPKIVTIPSKKLIGLKQDMSIAQNKTGQLWAQFGPQIKHITHRINSDKFSLQIYPMDYFNTFNPLTTFEKWALVAVQQYTNQPTNLIPFTLPGGKYAVFNYVGQSNDPSIFQYIYSEWLPKSGYQIDHRPHFEILGPKYQNNSPTSEEEIWIPIKE